MGREKDIKITRKDIKELRKDLKREKTRRRRVNLLLLALLGGGVAAAKSFAAKSVTPGSGTVTFSDDEPGVLSKMMGELMREYLKHPGKKAIADKMNVGIAIEDLDNPEMAVTMSFKGSDIAIANGAGPSADIYIGTELALLLSLAGAPSGLEQLKWLRSEDGQKIINALKSGRLRIRGVQKHPFQMILYQKFMSPPR